MVNVRVSIPCWPLELLLGKLTIHTGGNIARVTTSAASIGADGRVLVGVDGRGYLTMDGGTLTLNNTALIVGGEEHHDQRRHAQRRPQHGRPER